MHARDDRDCDHPHSASQTPPASSYTLTQHRQPLTQLPLLCSPPRAHIPTACPLESTRAPHPHTVSVPRNHQQLRRSQSAARPPSAAR
eukprot:6449995-Prymnesium_polylepis.1